MATSVPITGLPVLAPASVQGDDLLPIVDVHDLTDPTGTTKQIVLSALGNSITGLFSRIFNVRDALYGATGNGTTDDTVAIQAAITAAAVQGGRVYLPPGTYAISSSGTSAALTIPANVSFMQEKGALLSYTGRGQAVVLSSWLNNVGEFEIVRSSIQWRDLTTDTTSEGLRIVNDRCSNITVRGVTGFVKNVNLYGDSGQSQSGTFGTIIYLGLLLSGWKQLTATAVSAGFANSVTIVGGVTAYVSADTPGGTPIVGTRFIDLGSTGDGWAFLGTNVEGTGPEKNIEITSANNTFSGCRYETVRKVHCLSGSLANVFIGGYGGSAYFDGTVWVDDSHKNAILSGGPVGGSTQNAYGTYNDGLSQPAYTARCSTGDGGVLYEGHDSTQALSFQVLGNGTIQAFPSAGSANPTCTVNLRTGVIAIGSGAAPPTQVFPPIVTALVVSPVTMNNGAAAAVGTLTNAPTAGNPTKWIPINDNGTTRYLPAW